MPKWKSIKPIKDYFDGLEAIQARVEMGRCRERTLRRWYGNVFDVTATTSRDYINSLQKCGLLVSERRTGYLECEFDSRMRNWKEEVIMIIDRNVHFILDMVTACEGGASERQLLKIGRSKYGLSDRCNESEITNRSGWLKSAGMLERRAGKFWATDRGRDLLINPKEYGGRGEGLEHRTLKEYVCENAEKVIRKRRVSRRQCEFPLPSGDKVDVSAELRGAIWLLEVKSWVSSDVDLRRGIYQCVKYEAVARAKEEVERRRPRKVVSMLIVEQKLPEQCRRLAEELGVKHRVLNKKERKSLGEKRKEGRRG